MAKVLTAETVQEFTAACIELPWLDEVRLCKGQVHSVTIIPSDDVSTEAKLMMTFEDESGIPRRVLALLQAMAAELGCGQPITAIVHGGGACYTFLLADNRSVSIPTDEMSAETYLRVLFLLKEISVMAQALFVVRAR
jgi:hypothetical protein